MNGMFGSSTGPAQPMMGQRQSQMIRRPNQSIPTMGGPKMQPGNGMNVGPSPNMMNRMNPMIQQNHPMMNQMNQSQDSQIPQQGQPQLGGLDQNQLWRTYNRLQGSPTQGQGMAQRMLF